jgi:UDP-N-acetylmuramoyl-L-alanyl-D-glutamate--2,6-diaminopimelate ligase
MEGHCPTGAWRLGDLLKRAGVAPTEGAPSTALLDVRIARLSSDSRDVGPGTCFIALAGGQADGHAYVDAALSGGAAAAIVEQGRYCGLNPSAIAVPDTHDAVGRLAAVFYGIDEALAAGRLRLAGVTGTNGKPTVCALLRAILDAAGARSAVLGTIANDVLASTTPAAMTTPPPIELCELLGRAVAAGASHAVMEVSSHALDQRRCAGLTFQVGVFTNLTHDHLDYHLTWDDYARAKKRLFDGLGPDAAAIVNADDPRWAFMVEDTAAQVVRFSTGVAATDVRVVAEQISLDGTRLRLQLRGSSLNVRTRLIGRHNVSNIVAAATAAEALGVSPDAIRRGLEAVTTVRGRLQSVTDGAGSGGVFVDYAHTPDALKNVLGILRELTGKRLICVFGCGGDRDRSKRPIMGRIVADLADLAYLTSDNPRSEDPGAIIDEVLPGFVTCRQKVVVEPDRGRAIASAIEAAAEGDTVLIAGKGHEDYQIIGSRRLHFDDVAIATEALRRRREVAV